MAKKDNSALAWLIGLGTLTVAGIGIYFYEKSQPAAPTTAPGAAAGTNVGAQLLTVPGLPQPITYTQAVALFASVNRTTVAALQSAGVPAAMWDGADAQIQSVLTAMGLHRNAT